MNCASGLECSGIRTLLGPPAEAEWTGESRVTNHVLHADVRDWARPFSTAFAPSRKDFVQFFSKDDTNTTLPFLVSAAPGPFQPAT